MTELINDNHFTTYINANNIPPDEVMHYINKELTNRNNHNGLKELHFVVNNRVFVYDLINDTWLNMYYKTPKLEDPLDFATRS